MFDALLIRLRDDFGSIAKALRLHDRVLSDFYSKKDPDPWAAERLFDPGKPWWEIYNQCAALTRMYAVYSAFIEDLLREYLLILPNLYNIYADLPSATTTQHRVGLGQILLKLGNEGPYVDLDEAQVIIQFSRGLSGERPYALLPQAFFIDRQNYRLDTLAKLLGYIGLPNAADRLSRHGFVRSCIEENWPEATNLRAKLREFVELRNLAAHSELDNTISLDELLSMSELLLAVCGAVADILATEVWQRQLSIKKLVKVGEVFHTYQQGKIATVKMQPCTLDVGEEIVVLNGDRVRFTVKILSIQTDGQERQSVKTELGQDLGLGFDRECKKGMSIAQFVRPIPEPQQLNIPLTEPQETEPEESELSADQTESEEE